MNEVSDIVIFLGRFHPLIVHLPIGFIMFAFLLEILSKWKNLKELRAAIPYALLFGAITAAKACLLGYMLASSGEYDGPMLDGHFWFGIATTTFTLLAWLISIDKIKFIKLASFKANIATLTFLVVLISITGHYGGNLTHGADYLTKYAPFGEKPQKIAPPKDVNDVVLFDHVIYPILEEKCMSCHNPSKKKGGLALDNAENILKGGKKGLAIVPGDIEKSGVFHRVTLNHDDKEFMPPDGKTPLTEEEISLLSFWIKSAKADFSIKLVAAEEKEEILKTALAYLNMGEHAKETLPEVQPADSIAVAKLANAGFTLRELVYNSGIYDVVLPSKTAKSSEETTKLLEQLAAIKNNVLWLSLQDNQVTDTHLKTIAQFKNLKQLYLNKNAITDKGIAELKTIETLKSLNLYGTEVSKESFASLVNFKSLQNVYVWKTKVTNKDVKEFEKQNSAIKLHLGITK